MKPWEGGGEIHHIPLDKNTKVHSETPSVSPLADRRRSMWPTESDLVFFIWENRKKKKRRENATTMRLADFRWLSIRCDAIRFDSIRRRTVARCAGPRFRFGRFALVDQISRERERENEWNGATFSPFLYFSGEGGERETGGTHQKQNGGGAKDDDDDDDDDVRPSPIRFSFPSK